MAGVVPKRVLRFSATGDDSQINATMSLSSDVNKAAGTML